MADPGHPNLAGQLFPYHADVEQLQLAGVVENGSIEIDVPSRIGARTNQSDLTAQVVHLLAVHHPRRIRVHIEAA